GARSNSLRAATTSHEHPKTTRYQGTDATWRTLARRTSEGTQRLSLAHVPRCSAWVDRVPRGLHALRRVHDRRPAADLHAGRPAGRRAAKCEPAVHTHAPSAAALAIARAYRVPVRAASRVDPDADELRPRSRRRVDRL